MLELSVLDAQTSSDGKLSMWEYKRSESCRFIMVLEEVRNKQVLFFASEVPNMDQNMYQIFSVSRPTVDFESRINHSYIVW